MKHSMITILLKSPQWTREAPIDYTSITPVPELPGIENVALVGDTVGLGGHVEHSGFFNVFVH
jgi:hypothetical protein